MARERLTRDGGTDVECGVGEIWLGHCCPWWKSNGIDTRKRRVVYVQGVVTAALAPLIECRQYAVPFG